ncbi:MAG: tetratricopeptide repeat protein [Elusimicrobiota bacterium]
MSAFLIEKLCLPLFNAELFSVSLWQALFLASAALAAWSIRGLLRTLPRKTLLCLAAILAGGIMLRAGLSPRNVVQTHYRGCGQMSLVAGGESYGARSLDDVQEMQVYYSGYGYAEYLRLALRVLPGTPGAAGFLAGGIAACTHCLLMFVLALVFFRDSGVALFCALLEACCPSAIRLAFGDNVFTFGAVPLLLALIYAALLREDRGWPVLLGAALSLGCVLGVHVAFLPVLPAAVLFFSTSGESQGVLLPVSRTKLGVLAAALLLLALPALFIQPLPFVYRAWAGTLGQPAAYLTEVVRFMAGARNPFFNIRFSPPIYMLLFFVGAAIAAIRSPRRLGAVLLSVFLLESAVVIVAGSPHAALVKHAHILPLYLLMCGFGAAGVCAALRSPAWRAAGSSILAAAALAQPLLYLDGIVSEHNMQRELSFLRDAPSRIPLGSELFSLGDITPLPHLLWPKPPTLLTLNSCRLPEGSTGLVPDKPAVTRYLRCLLGTGYRPVLYLSLRCYGRRFDETHRHASPPLRDECARILNELSLEPLLEESFESDPYCPETDVTPPGRIRLGFYRVSPKDGRRAGPGIKTLHGCQRELFLADLATSGSVVPPSPLESQSALVERRLAQGRASQALALAGDLTDAHPEGSGVWGLLARAAEASGNHEDALRALERALEVAAGPADRHAAALLYQDLGEFPRARAILEGLVLEMPQEAVFHRDKGICEFLAGEPRKAERSLSRALDIEPRLLSAALSLGSLQAEAGRRDAALRTYRRALAESDPPEGEMMRTMLRRALRELESAP